MKLSRLKGRKTSERILREGKVWKGKTLVVRYEMGLPRLRPAFARATAGRQGFGGQTKNQRVNTVIHPSTGSGLFVGTLTSSKTEKSAVKRNRMRRRCREALRKEVKDKSGLPTMQLLLMPRRSSLTCDFADIEEDVRAFLSHVI